MSQIASTSATSAKSVKPRPKDKKPPVSGPGLKQRPRKAAGTVDRPAVEKGRGAFDEAVVALTLLDCIRSDEALRPGLPSFLKAISNMPAFWEQEGKRPTATLVPYLDSLSKEQREAVKSMSAKSAFLEMHLRNDADLMPDLLPVVNLLSGLNEALEGRPGSAETFFDNASLGLRELTRRKQAAFAPLDKKQEKKARHSSAPSVLVRFTEEDTKPKKPKKGDSQTKQAKGKKTTSEKQASTDASVHAQLKRENSSKSPQGRVVKKLQGAGRFDAAWAYARSAFYSKGGVKSEGYEKWFEDKMLVHLPKLNGLDRAQAAQVIEGFLDTLKPVEQLLDDPYDFAELARKQRSQQPIGDNRPLESEGLAAYTKIVKNMLYWKKDKDGILADPERRLLIKDYPNSEEYFYDYRAVQDVFNMGSPGPAAAQVNGAMDSDENSRNANLPGALSTPYKPPVPQPALPPSSAPSSTAATPTVTTASPVRSDHVSTNISSTEVAASTSSPSYSRRLGRAALQALMPSTELVKSTLGERVMFALYAILSRMKKYDLDRTNTQQHELQSAVNNAVDSADLPDGQLKALEKATTLLKGDDGLLGTDEGAKILAQFVKLAGQAASELLASSSSEV